MDSIDAFIRQFQTLFTFTANRLAHETGVSQRQRTVTGATVLQTLIFGWLTQPRASVTQLTQMAALRGMLLSPQALDRRFTANLVTCMERFFVAAVTELCGGPGADPVAIPLLQRFSGVWILDSTTISLPKEAAARWPGCGGRPGEGLAAVKVQARVDLLRGRFDAPELTSGRTQDRATALQQASLPAGSLRLSDLGYFTLAVFRRLDAEQSFWLSRVPVNVTLLTDAGERISDVSQWLEAQAQATGAVDQPVLLGVTERLPARLLAVRVPEAVAAERRRRLRRVARKQGQMVSPARLGLVGWTVLATNVPAERLSLTDARSLYRARWQIELRFKQWKQDGQLDAWRSANPNRILVEIYAKLIGAILQQRLVLFGDWTISRKSCGKAGGAIRDHLRVIAAAFDRAQDLRRALDQLHRCLQAATKIGRGQKRPSTEQYLLAPHLER